MSSEARWGDGLRTGMERPACYTVACFRRASGESLQQRANDTRDIQPGVEQGRVTMSGAHTEEMVYATTEDGLLLEGVAMSPAATAGSQRPIGFIWIHGNAASFSAPAYVKVGRELAARGHLAIVGNTRGHDI